MNNQYSALLNYLLNSQGANTAKNVNDILNGTGLQGTYNTQVAVGNAATQAQQGVADNALRGPVNGSYVNAAPIQDSANQGMIKDSSMPVNLLLGVLQQASALQQNANNNAASVIGSAGQNQTQNRGLDLQYGVGNGGSGSNSGTGLNGQQAVVAVNNQGGGDLLDGLSPAQAYTKAEQIIAAGGVGTWRKTNPGKLNGNDSSMVNSANTSLNQIDSVVNQLNTSKSLKNILDNPVLAPLATIALKSGNQRLLQNFGLSSKDTAALDFLTSLGVRGDASAANGPVRSYLAKMLGPTNPGMDKTTKQNLELLNVMKKNIKTQLGSYAKQYGYNYYTDIPGLNIGSVKMVSPSGQTGTVDQAEVSDAIKNGWKEAQ